MLNIIDRCTRAAGSLARHPMENGDHAYYLLCLFHMKMSTLISPLHWDYCKKKLLLRKTSGFQFVLISTISTQPVSMKVLRHLSSFTYSISEGIGFSKFLFYQTLRYFLLEGWSYVCGWVCYSTVYEEFSRKLEKLEEFFLKIKIRNTGNSRNLLNSTMIKEDFWSSKKNHT